MDFTPLTAAAVGYFSENVARDFLLRGTPRELLRKLVWRVRESGEEVAERYCDLATRLWGNMVAGVGFEPTTFGL